MAEEIISKRDKTKLTHNGYIYVFDKCSKSDPTIRFWRCELKNACKGRIHTRNNEVLKEVNEHSHQSSALCVEIAMLKSNLKRKSEAAFDIPSKYVNGCFKSSSQIAQASFSNSESTETFSRKQIPVNSRGFRIHGEPEPFVTSSGETVEHQNHWNDICKGLKREDPDPGDGDGSMWGMFGGVSFVQPYMHRQRSKSLSPVPVSLVHSRSAAPPAINWESEADVRKDLPLKADEDTLESTEGDDVVDIGQVSSIRTVDNDETERTAFHVPDSRPVFRQIEGTQLNKEDEQVQNGNGNSCVTKLKANSEENVERNVSNIASSTGDGGVVPLTRDRDVVPVARDRGIVPSTRDRGIVPDDQERKCFKAISSLLPTQPRLRDLDVLKMRREKGRQMDSDEMFLMSIKNDMSSIPTREKLEFKLRVLMLLNEFLHRNEGR